MSERKYRLKYLSGAPKAGSRGIIAQVESPRVPAVGERVSLECDTRTFRVLDVLYIEQGLNSGFEISIGDANEPADLPSLALVEKQPTE